MAEFPKTYSEANDFPGGVCNTTKLAAEINAAATITTGLWRVDRGGGNIKIIFKADPSPTEMTALDGDTSNPAGGLLAAHDNTPSVNSDVVSIQVSSGGPTLIADGSSATLAENTWKRIDLSLVETVHLQAVHISWINAHDGDYGWLTLVHPSGTCNPVSAIAINDTTLTVPTGIGAVYNPLGGAQHVEFWNDTDDVLVEMAKIASVSGDIVTLVAGVVNAHSTSAKLRVCYGHHTTMRGANKIDGGMRFIGSGTDRLGSENQMTDVIPAGLTLAGRFKTGSTVASREFAVNFKLRQPTP